MMSASSTRRGALILFEGCDRSGKTTQCKLLASHLQKNGIKHVLRRFPDRTTTIGTMINDYLTNAKDLDDHTVHLLFSANRWECMEEIKKTLQEGTSIILDRYAYSGVAFSSAKGLDLEWCKAPDVGLVLPDVTLFLDLDPSDAQTRGGYGEERYENSELQTKVRQKFHELKDESWVVINAKQDVDIVHAEITKVVDQVLASPKGPLKPLWK